ncbi:serine/threonine protein kinase [Streptomyces sp. NBC_00207]|uniref:serine/threonine protein kinase n=1 Tax=unclassified Streptomyces TaxID=2593676 RepID=UPI0028871903|nr:protein kinase [Streptomyces sp. DSM 41633]
MSSLPDRIGPYRPLQRIGAGGMGTVYYAYHRDSGQPLAVKVLHEDHAGDRDHRKRFAREAAALRKVTGPYLVPLIDADPEAERPWLATPYVPGNTLHEHIRDHGKLTPGNLLTFAAATAHALACIHAAGIAHRDLKPPNVILAADGPRVVDFGIAHLLDATAVTATRVTTGTKGWMAPEQLRTGVTTTASDVYAWGVLVAYAASGKHPYGPPTGIEFRMERGDEYTLEDIPDRLAEQVHAALQMDPEDRPLAADLADTVAGMYGPQGTTVFPTMEFTRIAKFDAPDYELFPPLSRWDILAPPCDLTRDVPAPSAVVVPPEHQPAPPSAQRTGPGSGGVGDPYRPADPWPNPYPPISSWRDPNPPVPTAWAPGAVPKPSRAPKPAGGNGHPAPSLRRFALAALATVGVLVWAVYGQASDGDVDTALAEPTASATYDRSNSNDPGYVSPYTPDPKPNTTPSPTPTPSQTPTTFPLAPAPSPSTTAVQSGYPASTPKDAMLAVEKGRAKTSILFEPNPQPGEFHANLFCGQEYEGDMIDWPRQCSLGITNGTRDTVALVCTASYRDDLSKNEDFRQGDPEPDTGKITFYTPIVPPRYDMVVSVKLPAGKLPSRADGRTTVCQFAKL